MIVRPGSTEFDQQGRMKGVLDLPLCEEGRRQVERVERGLNGVSLAAIYTSPCESARETAIAISKPRKLKVSILEDLRNIDHGLWCGKRVDELRASQPKMYRQCQESAAAFCPPQGEPYLAAKRRVEESIAKITRKHKKGSVLLVAPEPLASVFSAELSGDGIEDIWNAEIDICRMEAFQQTTATNGSRDSERTWVRVGLSAGCENADFLEPLTWSGQSTPQAVESMPTPSDV